MRRPFTHAYPVRVGFEIEREARGAIASLSPFVCVEPELSDDFSADASAATRAPSELLMDHFCCMVRLITQCSRGSSIDAALGRHSMTDTARWTPPGIRGRPLLPWRVWRF